jgi:hypothetical protein
VEKLAIASSDPHSECTGTNEHNADGHDQGSDLYEP